MSKRFLTLAGILAVFSLTACDVQKSVTVGSVAPSLTTKTLADVGGDFSLITTYRYPDERMYQYSLDKALAAGKPVVLEFATPGHCTVCDVQLQMLKGIMEKYQNDVLFLHMDQYRNPEAFTAFQVMGDPWTFVIDRNQVVQFKRAGRLLYDELDATLTRVMSVQLRQEDRGQQVG
ncbi:MAG: thioredoxin family protein [Chromatiales bacterium]|jgi:thiol-disulfide isomerase/thioredoxin|nr:thioredoxin family protein [Chromatiales bacterium]